MVTRLHGHVEKGWGFERIIVSNDNYCLKELHFNTNQSFSMHFHKYKLETWHVLDGSFIMETIDMSNASRSTTALDVGDTHTVEPMVPHRLTCTSAFGGSILEVSTPDSVEDNYRVEPGASQKI